MRKPNLHSDANTIRYKASEKPHGGARFPLSKTYYRAHARCKAMRSRGAQRLPRRRTKRNMLLNTKKRDGAAARKDADAPSAPWLPQGAGTGGAPALHQAADQTPPEAGRAHIKATIVALHRLAAPRPSHAVAARRHLGATRAAGAGGAAMAGEGAAEAGDERRRRRHERRRAAAA